MIKSDRRRAARFPRDDRALRRVRNSRDEKTGARRRGHQDTSGNSSVYSDAEYEMVEDEDTFTEAPWRQEHTGQTFFELEIREKPPSPKCTSLTRSDRWFWLERETTGSTKRS